MLSSSPQMQAVQRGGLTIMSRGSCTHTQKPILRQAVLMSCRATALADQLNLDFALINRKRRRDLSSSVSLPTVPPTPAGSDSSSHESDDEAGINDKMELLVGDVKGRVAILIDDMIDTGHTVGLATGVLKDSGAKAVYALISHGASISHPWPSMFS